MQMVESDTVSGIILNVFHIIKIIQPKFKSQWHKLLSWESANTSHYARDHLVNV